MLFHKRGYFPAFTKPVVRRFLSAALARFSLCVIAVSAMSATTAHAAVRTLYAFGPYDNIGSNPDGTLLRDASGALYGTNMLGGAYYNGTVFKLTPPAPGQTDWSLSVLYTFKGGYDGGLPNPNLVMDETGAIYGSAESGGSWMNQGVVFKLTPPTQAGTEWNETVLHTFDDDSLNSASDGAYPSGGLIMDEAGALYGTTDLGGNLTDPSLIGYGTVFKLTPLDAGKTTWAETVIYRFGGSVDGRNPMATLTLDRAGSLYGSTLYGGTGACNDFFAGLIGCGTVFRLTPPAPGQTTWSKTTLHNFAAGDDGSVPQGKLLVDWSGAVYGTTYQGGTGMCRDSLQDLIGCGVIYKLTPPAPFQAQWMESIIHDFAGPDGAFPQGGLVMDSSGALYGTASGGGPVSYGVVGGYGVAFKLVPPSPLSTNWTETVLHNFDISTSGDEPVGELVPDPDGHLFGVAYMGGPMLSGTVFELTP